MDNIARETAHLRGSQLIVFSERTMTSSFPNPWSVYDFGGLANLVEGHTAPITELRRRTRGCMVTTVRLRDCDVTPRSMDCASADYHIYTVARPEAVVTYRNLARSGWTYVHSERPTTEAWSTCTCMSTRQADYVRRFVRPCCRRGDISQCAIAGVRCKTHRYFYRTVSRKLRTLEVKCAACLILTTGVKYQKPHFGRGARGVIPAAGDTEPC
jgi:hypothetical protein